MTRRTAVALSFAAVAEEAGWQGDPGRQEDGQHQDTYPRPAQLTSSEHNPYADPDPATHSHQESA